MPDESQKDETFNIFYPPWNRLEFAKLNFIIRTHGRTYIMHIGTLVEGLFMYEKGPK